MLKHIRQQVIHDLWMRYRANSVQMLAIEAALKQKGIADFVLDHFAIIDLPGPNTGIKQLSQLFAVLGYTMQGQDYLPDKQNDFLWMAEPDIHLTANKVLAQVVVADFRLAELPDNIRAIIEKYASLAQPCPVSTIAQLIARGDKHSLTQAHALVLAYLTERDWPLPTTNEFYTVHEFNELLAWVLVFGRRTNHFTLSVHLLDHFTDLHHFNQFITEEVGLPLNTEGGSIKGSKTAGIAQSSTAGIAQTISLADGEITMPTGFVEFVWRHPRDARMQQPVLWQDYFTGFIAQHADHVIESLL